MPLHENDRDILLRLIKAKPGISQTELLKATQGMDTEKRNANLAALARSGEIVARLVRTGRGGGRRCYWEATAAPRAIGASPLDAAIQEMRLAKAKAIAAIAYVDSAIEHAESLALSLATVVAGETV